MTEENGDTMDGQELSEDVIHTVNALMQTMDNPDPEENPMAGMMDPQEMVEMFKPQLRQKVMAKPDRTLEALAVVNQATSDILEKHASDEDVEELAARGIADENE